MLILIPTLGEVEVLFGIKTVKELEQQPLTESEFAGRNCFLGYIGFGNIASGVLSSFIISEVKSRSSWSAHAAPASGFTAYLAGICGTYDPAVAAIGKAYQPGGLISYGIGAGEGQSFLPPSAIGIPQYTINQIEVSDRIDIGADKQGSSGIDFLSVCSASSSRNEAETRKLRYPTAACEEMEGFGAALACKIHGINLTVIRGVSNIAGDRYKRNWKITEALETVKIKLESTIL